MQCKIVLALCCACALAGQDSSSTSVRQQKKRERRLQRELGPSYKTWLDGDVAYIISDEERRAFTRLSNDEEREQFVEQFWMRRDPTPDTVENEFKEEHYRRIAYANERFASGIPGWKTDRGRIYIQHGPPDEIESHPSGGTYQRPIEEGGGSTSAYPFEKWRYRHLDGVGEDVLIEFVDRTLSGEYRMTADPAEKDALRYSPGSQQQPSNVSLPLAGQSEFDRIERAVNVLRPPRIRFKDLEAVVSSSIRYNALPMQVRTDFIPLTSSSILSNITLQFDRRDLQFQQKDGLTKAVVNVHARVSSLSRRPVSSFEEVISVEAGGSGPVAYQKALPLAPGRYRLNVAAKDVIGGGMASYEGVVEAPPFKDGEPAASSLILADVIERVPAMSTGAGQFVVGDKKVRPRVGEVFRSDEKLGIYMQLYHLHPGARGGIEYQILHTGSNDAVLDYVEDLSALEGSSSQKVVLKWLPLESLTPGRYVLRIRVTEADGGEVLAPTAGFTVVSSERR
jgi:GWxTD domain-containing protein